MPFLYVQLANYMDRDFLPVDAKEFPAQETTLTDGEIAFRQHEGGHTSGPNWPYFIRFASRYFE